MYAHSYPTSLFCTQLMHIAYVAVKCRPVARGVAGKVPQCQVWSKSPETLIGQRLTILDPTWAVNQFCSSSSWYLPIFVQLQFL